MKAEIKKCPVLENELERLMKLYHYDLLEVQAEKQFDDLTELTALLLGLPICQITLMDKDWQHFLSNVGTDMKGNHREMSFCQYTVVQNQILEIKDTTKDERFKTHPLVINAPNLRYYVGAPLIDDDGLILGTLCGYGLEVGELSQDQKEILEKLAKTIVRLIRYRKINKDQEKYVNIFGLTQDLLCVISKTGYFQMVNPSFTKLLGWSEDQLLTKPILAFVHDDDKDNVRKELSELQIGNQKLGFKCRLTTKSNKHIWFSWSYFSDVDSPVLVASGHDMTELLETQSSLEIAVNRAHKASKIKDEFLSNMNHEIRTPLSSIIGFTELLTQTDLDQNQKKYVENAEVASNHLMNIVNDALDIYKLEDGGLTLENGQVSIKGLMSKIKKLFEHKAESKGLTLEVSVHPEIPDLVSVDETRLIQILSNLVVNAVKFTDTGRIDVRLDLISKIEDKVKLKFEVEDTGIGIDADLVKTIFERFTKAQKSTSKLYGGTGLGLSISKYLVNLYNGELHVESQKHVGTKFWFEIELETIKESSTTKNKGVSHDLSGFQILLAEDNEHLQLLCEIHIKRLGGEITTASSGKEAVEFLKSKEFGLVLMDIQMPVMDGITAAQVIRNELNLKVPIVGFSANADPKEKARCAEAGMNDFLSKPFSIEELIRKIVNIYPKKSKAAALENFKEILSELAEKEGADLVDQFKTIFIKRIPNDISELEEALSNNDLMTLNNKAHFLTTTFTTMNFKKGAEMTGQIQSAYKQNDESSVLQKSKTLLEYLEKALRAVSS